jgi:hypothetical protein
MVQQNCYSTGRPVNPHYIAHKCDVAEQYDMAFSQSSTSSLVILS